MNHSFNTAIAKDYSWEEAVILENIYFWCKKNEANGKLTDGEPWTYNTVKAFNIIFDYLSPSVISRALKRLEENGLVKVGCFNKDSHNRTKWYCITDKTKEYYEPKVSKSNSQNCEMENSEMKNGIRKDEKSISQNCEMLYTDINTDNKPNINSDISSSQPAESSDKDSLPQEENSNSHSDLFSEQNEMTNSHSVSFADCKRKTKKKSGISYKNSDYTLVYQAYLDNVDALIQQGKLKKKYEIPYFLKKDIKKFFTAYGVEKVLNAVKKSINDYWLVNNTDYSPTVIFNDKVMYNLIKDLSSDRTQTYSKPAASSRQFDDDHLIF